MGDPAAAGAAPASGMQADLFEGPTDVAWDNDGNIFVADGTGNARVAKFTRDGVFVKSWGSRGTADGQFKTGSVGAIAVADSDPNVVYAGMGEACVRGNPGDRGA